MSTGNTLLAALESLNHSVSGIEEALTKLESRPKTRRPRDHQMDLFTAPAPIPMPSAATSALNTQDLTHRLNRVIAQIETVLSAA